jgi:hypothetical protein
MTLANRVVFTLCAICSGLLVSSAAWAQPIEPEPFLEGVAVGVFNSHDQRDLVPHLPGQGVEAVWPGDGEPVLVFAAIELAERNSLANFTEGGVFRAAVATAVAPLLDYRPGGFLLQLLLPAGDRFGEEPVMVTLNVIEPLETSWEPDLPTELVRSFRITLTSLPPAPGAETTP